MSLKDFEVVPAKITKRIGVVEARRHSETARIGPEISNWISGDFRKSLKTSHQGRWIVGS